MIRKVPPFGVPASFLVTNIYLFNLVVVLYPAGYKFFAGLLIALSVFISFFSLPTLGFYNANCANEVLLKVEEESRIPFTRYIPSFIHSKNCRIK